MTIAVKENQKNLYREISEYFGDEEFLKEIKDNGGYKITREKAHSQIETREYYKCDRIKWMQEKSRWKGMDKEHWNDMQDNKAGWERGNRKKVLYQQPAVRCVAVCQNSERTLASGKYALASGCNF